MNADHDHNVDRPKQCTASRCDCIYQASCCRSWYRKQYNRQPNAGERNTTAARTIPLRCSAVARQPSVRVYSQCRERIRGDSSRLSGRTDNRRAVSEVRLITLCFVCHLILVPSLKYHRLHPEYIHQRIERLGLSYNLRILLLVCDVVRLVSARTIQRLTEAAERASGANT